MPTTICPVCKKQVTENHFACVRAAQMGRATSKAKTAASRRNGKLGGRPKKIKDETI